MCERESERESVCERGVGERESVCEVRECVCVIERERGGVRERECVCDREERERERRGGVCVIERVCV